MHNLRRCHSRQCCSSPLGTEASSKGIFSQMFDSGFAYVFKNKVLNIFGDKAGGWSFEAIASSGMSSR